MRARCFGVDTISLPVMYIASAAGHAAGESAPHRTSFRRVILHSTPCPVSKCPCPSRAGWPISREADGSPTKRPLPRTGSGGSPLQRKGPPTDQVKFDPKNPGQTTFLLLKATGCNVAVVSPVARQQASVNGPRNTVTVDTVVFVRSLTEPSQQQHDRNDRTETAHAYVHRWRGAA